MSHNDDTPEHGDIEHHGEEEQNLNIDVEDDDQGEGSECNITSDDLDQIANLVDTIKEIYAEVDSDSVKAVSTEIDNSIQAIMMDLGNKLTPELSQEVASVYNLNAKFAFYNVCFSKSYDILNKVDPKLASVFSNIQDTNVFVVSKFTEKLLALHPTIAELIQRLEEVENERKTSASNKKNGKSGSVNGSSSDIEELRREIALLREENKIAQDKISRQAREIDRIKKDGGQQVGASNTSKSQVSRKPKFHEDGAVKTAKSSKRIESGDEHVDEYGSVSSKGPQLLNWINMNQNIGFTSKRVVTLRQAKDLIEEIAQSKQKFDQKCMEAPIPRETMEQHMYNYLSQKFGLRSLVVEWATALVNCLKIYWSKDSDCALFAMILKNECDEDFIGIQKEVKLTIQNLFRVALKAKFPNKKNEELNRILEEKFKGMVTQEECIQILRYIYKDEDFNDINEKLERSLLLVESKTTSGNKEPRKQMMIKYKEFEKIILDFQLMSHRDFLAKFITLFRQYDVNNFGYVIEEQFREMINTVDPEQKLDIDEILQSIDPQEMGYFPFSACVSIFSRMPMTEDPEGITTIMHYIAGENI